MNILIWLILGGVIGWLASVIMRTQERHPPEHRGGHRGRPDWRLADQPAGGRGKPSIKGTSVWRGWEYRCWGAIILPGDRQPCFRTGRTRFIT